MNKILFLIIAVFANLTMSPSYLNEAQNERYDAELEKLRHKSVLTLTRALPILPTHMLHEIAQFYVDIPPIGEGRENFWRNYIYQELKVMDTPDSQKPLKNYPSLCINGLNLESPYFYFTDQATGITMTVHNLHYLLNDKGICGKKNEINALILSLALDAFMKALDKKESRGHDEEGYFKGEDGKYACEIRQKISEGRIRIRRVRISYGRFPILDAEFRSGYKTSNLLDAFSKAFTEIGEIIEVFSARPNAFLTYLNTLRHCFSCLQ